MAAASVSSFDGLAGQKLASRLDNIRWNLHLQLCDKIRRDYLIRRDDKILWSGDGVSPDREEEENHVSSGNKEGRLDDDSGSNDGRLNFLLDGGGIEEPQHKTAETVISHRTDSLESFVQSVIVQWLREHLNLDNWETIFQNIDLDDKIWFEQDILPCPHALITDGVSTDNEEVEKQDILPRPILGPPRRWLRFNCDEEICVKTEEEEEEEEEDILSPRPALITNIISTENEEEDDHVSSENKEGRLDDDSGSNDGRLNFLPDGGGIEEPQHKTAETVICHGFDGLESSAQSAMVPFLREHVNLDNQKTIFQNFDFEYFLRTHPSYITRLNQITKNMSTELSQMQKTNPELSSEELKMYYVPICWSSTTRLEFFCRLSDTLLKATAPSQPNDLKDLLSELESKEGPQVFDGRWIDKIDSRWIDKIDRKYRPSEHEYISVRGLLHFVRNRWRHTDEFKECFGSDSAEDFYSYFDERFPNLLMVSYGAAHLYCRETWFKRYR